MTIEQILPYLGDLSTLDHVKLIIASHYSFVCKIWPVVILVIVIAVFAAFTKD